MPPDVRPCPLPQKILDLSPGMDMLGASGRLDPHNQERISDILLGGSRGCD